MHKLSITAKVHKQENLERGIGKNCAGSKKRYLTNMANSLRNLILHLHSGPAELGDCLTGNTIIKENAIGTTIL